MILTCAVVEVGKPTMLVKEAGSWFRALVMAGNK